MKKLAGVVPSKPKRVAGVILSKPTYDIHISKRHQRTVLGGDKENILTVLAIPPLDNHDRYIFEKSLPSQHAISHPPL